MSQGLYVCIKCGTGVGVEERFMEAIGQFKHRCGGVTISTAWVCDDCKEVTQTGKPCGCCGKDE